MSDDELLGLEQQQYPKLDQPRGFPTAAQVVGVWRQKYDEGVLNETHFKEHWRLYVPRVLVLDAGANVFDSAFDEDHVQNTLFAPIEQFICDGNPNDVFDRIRRFNDPPTVCGKVFKMSEPTYNCRECGADGTCVLCVDCFKKSEHRNHKYKMSTSNGGGCCDCGDVEAWKNNPYCSVHVVGTLEGAAAKRTQFPDDMRQRTKIAFNAVLQYAYQLLTVDHEPKLPADLRLKEIEDDPLSFLDSPDTYCTVLYNDEVHTFDQVISTLSKVIKCAQKDAINFVTNIDREGRAVVKISSFQHCNELKTEIERITSQNGHRPLRVQVKHSHVIAHQLYALRLLSWFQKILSYSKHFREVFAQVVLAILPTAKPPPGTSILEGVLLRDSSLWKTVRVHWHRLFIAGMLKEYENKKSFAEIFTKNYGSIMKDFIIDDHDHTFSVAALGVQIFTVPTIAHHLIAHKDVLMVLLNTFWSECGPFLKDGKLEFQRNENVASGKFKRSLFIIFDLSYLLSSTPESWTNELRKGFLQGLFLFLRLLSAMQGMDSVTRQVGQHMEYEPEWETAFNLHIRLSSVITSILKWCGSDRVVLIKSYKETLKKLHEDPIHGLNNAQCLFEIANHSTSCYVYDVRERAVSIHLPLSRFLAGLHVQLEKYGLEFHSREFTVNTTKQSPELIIEPVLRTQVMIAQVQAGMWRRNGYSILHQIYFYHNIKCCEEMWNKDVILLQMGAALIERNEFLMHLLNKFNLIEWADANYEQTTAKRAKEETWTHTIMLVEEFLALLITIVSERYVVGVGKVTPNDCIKNEIIQQLCVRPLSHSELSKALSPDTKNGTNVDEIVQEIATFRKPAVGSGKGVYFLKPQYYDQYNVFFYHYTKEELSKSEEKQRKRRKEADGLDCCPPPPLPPLTQSFRMLVDLLQCDVMFHLLQLVLKRANDLSVGSFSEAQLHRVLHLIGYALHEEQTRNYEFFVFTERSERWSLLKHLEALQKNARVEAYRDLIKWTITKFKQVALSTSQSKEERQEKMEVEIEGDAEECSDDSAAKEKQRIAKLAAERKQKLMAQMKSAQKSFIKDNAKAYEEATLTDRIKQETMLWKTMLSIEFAVALGPEQTSHNHNDPTYTCILCQEHQTIKVNAPAMVFGAFVQRSTVLKNDYTSPTQKLLPPETYYLPTTLSPSPFTSTCGHAMHASCWEKHFSNISTKESRRIYRSRQPISFDVDKQEFLCPLCESLNNSVLPMLQPLSNVTTTRSPLLLQRLTFNNWLGSVIVATEKKHQESKARKAAAAAETNVERMETDEQEGANFRDRNDDDDTNADEETGRMVQAVLNPYATSGLYTRLQNSLKDSSTSTPVPGLDDMEVMILPKEAEGDANENAPVMSNSVLNMIHKYAKSVNTKGLGVSVADDDNLLMLHCWKSCAYTIHVVEAVVRRRGRSLLGDLSTRQRKCIKALIRLCAMQEVCRNQRVVNNHAIRLLGLVFDNVYGYDDTCILDWDPFGMMVALVMCLPSLFYHQTPSPFPTGTALELYALRLMFVATIAQILIGVEPPPTATTTTNDEDDEDTACLVHYVKAIRDDDKPNTKLLWEHIKEKSVPFLRCACIFFRYLTGVTAPECLRTPGCETYDNMCRYLGLPRTCKELLDDELVLNVFRNWVKKWRDQQQKLNCELRLNSYLEFNGLIPLPDDYSELINSVSSFTCPNGDHEDSRNPTLCLVCNTMLCSQSYCCQKELNGVSVGACAYHAYECGAGAGIFLRVRECEILFLSWPNRGCFLAPPYLDEYGETDQGLKRGNPLKLCRERYRTLENIWLGHAIHEEVSRSLEFSHTLTITQWQHY